MLWEIYLLFLSPDLLDGQGILLSLGLDAGSLDLKAEAMQEEDADQYGDHDQQNSPEGSMPDHHHHNNNERLLEHCESAISGGDTEHPEEDAMEDVRLIRKIYQFSESQQQTFLKPLKVVEDS